MTTSIPITAIDRLNRDLKQLSKKLTSETTVLVQKKLTFDILAGVIRRTPVDEGRARGGWQVGIGEAPGVAPNRIDKNEDPMATQAFVAGMTALSGLQPFSVVFIVNNVDYILVLDQGLFTPPDPGPSKDRRPDRKGKILVSGGYSMQAPLGMVDVTIEEVRQQV